MRVSAALSDSSGVAEGGWNLTRQVIIYGESEIKRPIRKIIWVTGEVLKNYNVTFYGILVFIGPAVLHGLWYLAGNVKTSRHGGVGGLDFRSKDAQNNSFALTVIPRIACLKSFVFSHCNEIVFCVLTGSGTDQSVSLRPSCGSHGSAVPVRTFASRTHNV